MAPRPMRRRAMSYLRQGVYCVRKRDRQSRVRGSVCRTATGGPDLGYHQSTPSLWRRQSSGRLGIERVIPCMLARLRVSDEGRFTMRQGQPSRTALAAAFHRAAHQVLERGFIFADPLATRILGADLEAALRGAQNEPSQRRMRLFIAVRTRFAEEALTACIQGGLRQIVV